MSAKKRKRRLQIAQDHQNWTIEDWKNVVWSDESRFLLRHSDDRVRIWHKEHESMNPSSFVSTVHAGGGLMVWGIFSWHTLGPLVPIEHRLNATAYRSIVAEYCLLMATSSRIMHHVKKLKSSQTGFLNMTMRFKVKVQGFFIIRHIHNHTSIISSEMQVELKKNTAFT